MNTRTHHHHHHAWRAGEARTGPAAPL